MASRKRIFNEDHNCYYDLGAIALGIENCAIAWVEEGVSVRCLSDEERREAEFQREAEKVKRIAASEPVPYSELHGVIRTGPKCADSRGLARATTWFFETALPRKEKVGAAHQLCAQ